MMESSENDGFNFAPSNNAPPDQSDFSFPDKYNAPGGEKIYSDSPVVERSSLVNETVGQSLEVANEKEESMAATTATGGATTSPTKVEEGVRVEEDGSKEANNKGEVEGGGGVAFQPPDLSFVLPKRESSGSEEANTDLPSSDHRKAVDSSANDTATGTEEKSEKPTEEGQKLIIDNAASSPSSAVAPQLADTVPVSSTQDSEEVTLVNQEEVVKEMNKNNDDEMKPLVISEPISSSNDDETDNVETGKDTEIGEEGDNKEENNKVDEKTETEEEESDNKKDKEVTDVDMEEGKLDNEGGEGDDGKSGAIKEEKDQHMDIEEVSKSPKEVILDHINTVYQCLDNFMKTKDEVIIKDCMSILLELKSLADKTLDAAITKQTNSHEENKDKKGKRGKGKQVKIRDTSSSKKDKNSAPADDSELDDLPGLVNLKDIKGLAVFAKWPNSGWFYPGMVKGLMINDWKNSVNVRVNFYDGLERDMKSIHILPAQLIPPSSVLFDLDEETELTVVSSERSDDWVRFSLNSQNKSDEIIERDFDKLAIKGTHMKAIKQSIDSSSDPAASKSNPVTPENMVAGRRMRGKSSIFNEDYVSSSPRSTEKRRGKTDDDSSKSSSNRTPAKRKAKTEEEETPATSATKSRRQVNGGTKSSSTTPRRKGAAAKGK